MRRIEAGRVVRSSLSPVVRGNAFALIIYTRTIATATLVTVSGEIDMLSAPEVRDRVSPLPEG
jgi:hypothetical protein